MVDVCLVVEGNYPYVTGGVSAWAHGLLEGMPDLSFAVAHVRTEGTPRHEAAYELPAGVDLVHVDVEAGEIVPERGLERALPEARVYHATATGTASEIARRAAAAHGAGFALTEHGMAWRDLVMMPKVPKSHSIRPDFDPAISAEERRRLAADAFRLARRAYAEAGMVTSVCGPNALVQAAAGAAHERLRVIPNPVALTAPGQGEAPLAAFVGRVAPEKDVATYLRACSLVAAEREDARFAVVGPLDQDPAYADECVTLAAELGLGDRVRFTGETDPQPWYAAMDVLALTSVTEAQPLVALEAMAAGVPVVATDVGGCREAIGDAGLLTAPRAPRATADAILRLLADDLLRGRLGRAGRRRAAERHDPARVYGAYREMYERLAA
ncbi:MAG: GT4 family glycosyltransferase PelF [Solirubrobacteraceae bacterium]